MKINLKKLLISVAIPLAVGGLSALLTSHSMKAFESLLKPPLSPPGWLFPVVWTILYILMGTACYLVCVSGSSIKRKCLIIYGVQLFFNFFWSIIFFNMQVYLFALIWILIILALIIAACVCFKEASRKAAYLMVPYIAWVAFASYLNFGIYILN